VNRFKGPILRGLAARAPYFHNGFAATLPEVVDFYDSRFRNRFHRTGEVGPGGVPAGAVRLLLQRRQPRARFVDLGPQFGVAVLPEIGEARAPLDRHQLSRARREGTLPPPRRGMMTGVIRELEKAPGGTDGQHLAKDRVGSKSQLRGSLCVWLC